MLVMLLGSSSPSSGYFCRATEVLGTSIAATKVLGTFVAAIKVLGTIVAATIVLGTLVAATRVLGTLIPLLRKVLKINSFCKRPRIPCNAYFSRERYNST